MEQEVNELEITCACRVDDRVIAIPWYGNKILFFDNMMQVVTRSIEIECESSEETELFSHILYEKDKVIFIPYHAKNLVILYLESMKIEYFKSIDGKKFNLGYVINNKVFLLDGMSGELYCFDLNKKDIFFVDRFVENEMKQKVFEFNFLPKFINGMIDGDKLIFPYRKNGYIYIYHIANKKGETREIKQNCKFVDITKVGEFYYILCENGEVIVLNEEFKIVRLINETMEHEIRYPYRYLYVFNNTIFLLPMYNQSILKVFDSKVEKIDCTGMGFGKGKYGILSNEKRGCVTILPSRKKRGITINLENNVYSDIMKIEHYETTLQKFIDRVKKDDKKEEHMESGIGKKIWECERME